MADTDPGNMLGSELSFVDDDDPDVLAVTPEHPAIAHLEGAIAALRSERPRLAAEFMYNAMTVVSDRDGVMAEF